MKLRFTIPGPPRTSKNSPIIPAAAIRAGGRAVLIPSPAYREWFNNSKPFMNKIRRELSEQGIITPINQPVSVAAQFYRERDSGDLCGFLQALGDFLQWRINDKQTKEMHYRGILTDDRQIASWDGSRLHIDAKNPRIEVVIEVLGPLQPVQEALPLAERWPELEELVPPIHGS